MTESRCGYVAIVGRPNVGKSTLMNHMLGMKVSITSRKPHTTRQRILGVLNRHSTQILFVDTPGLVVRHETQEREIKRFMRYQVLDALVGIDLAILMVDAKAWHHQDELALDQMRNLKVPILCAVNKIDRLTHKESLLPLFEQISGRYDFTAIVPVCALKGDGLQELAIEIEGHMPLGPHVFTNDEITDRPLRFLVAEAVREKITRQLGSEIPHQTAVLIERFKEYGRTVEIDALVCVEKNSQKSIVLGKNGRRLKSIGVESRKAIEKLIGVHVRLHLWVRVQPSWTNRQEALVALGYR